MAIVRLQGVLVREGTLYHTVLSNFDEFKEQFRAGVSFRDIFESLGKEPNSFIYVVDKLKDDGLLTEEDYAVRDSQSKEHRSLKRKKSFGENREARKDIALYKLREKYTEQEIQFICVSCCEATLVILAKQLGITITALKNALKEVESSIIDFDIHRYIAREVLEIDGLYNGLQIWYNNFKTFPLDKDSVDKFVYAVNQNLTNFERIVIWSRCRTNLTYSEIGEQYSVSKQYVQAVNKKALKKLRFVQCGLNGYNARYVKS